jgi:DNA mismatch repair protein MutL
LIHNYKVIYQFSATDKLKDRVFEVLGQEIAENLLEVDYNSIEMKVSGFIGKPQVARNNRKLQFLFVNNRPVNEYIIAKQVKDAFATLISRELFPVYILYIEIDTKMVDVNVHPRKSEVRFSEPQKIYRTIYRVISNTLDENELTKQVQEFDVPVTIKSTPKQHSPQPAQPIPQPKPTQFDIKLPTRKPVNQPISELANQPTSKLDNQSIFQIHKSYIIFETETGIKIFDQHACSERVQYEKILTEWEQDQLKKQQLLLPVTLDLPTIEANIIRLNMKLINKLGFELEELSNNSFMINSVPQELINREAAQLIKDIVGQMGSWELGQVKDCEKELTEPVDKILKMMACRSAVKFGDRLNNQEMQALIDNLELCQNKYSCVHGRPCVVEYSLEEFEKLFKRR